MTEQLAEVALAFCRECLGWEAAAPASEGDPFRIYRDPATAEVAASLPITSLNWPRDAYLKYTDLNAVMEAAEQFCRGIRQNVEIIITLNARLKKGQHGGYTVYIGRTKPDTDWKWFGLSVRTDLCHAILAACVDARRKLNKPKGSSGE